MLLPRESEGIERNPTPNRRSHVANRRSAYHHPARRPALAPAQSLRAAAAAQGKAARSEKKGTVLEKRAACPFHAVLPFRQHARKAIVCRRQGAGLEKEACLPPAVLPAGGGGTVAMRTSSRTKAPSRQSAASPTKTGCKHPQHVP